MMNKYSKLSNFEVNKLIAEHLGLIPYLFIADDIEKLIWNVESNNVFFGFISKKGCEIDFCSDPASAMPIVIENKISSVPQINGNLWICSYHPFYSTTDSLYRAAMEVFLLMKESQQ